MTTSSTPPDPAPPGRLTDDDRDLIKTAREIGPALRAKSGVDERLAGWLLPALADLAERLAGEEAGQ